MDRTSEGGGRGLLLSLRYAMEKRKKRGCSCGCLFGGLLLLLILLFVWNFAWFYATRAILDSRYQNKFSGQREIENGAYRYLFPKDIRTATNTLDIVDARFAVLGYDPNGVLNKSFNVPDSYNCDIEIAVGIHDGFLTIAFVPLEIATAQCHPRCDTYQIGKDCLSSGGNSFSFRHVSFSGGYGMGLGIREVVSTISFDDHYLMYDVFRNDHWLAFFAFPIVRRDGSHVVLNRMDGE